MKPKPPCPACGHPPASMIEDGYSIDLTPWWRYYVQKFNPFKRRRRMVPMEDVVPLIDAMEKVIEGMRPVVESDEADSLRCECASSEYGCERCSYFIKKQRILDRADLAYTKFIFKHPLP